jgi:hypothetical protein
VYFKSQPSISPSEAGVYGGGEDRQWPGSGGVLAKLRYVVWVKDSPVAPYRVGWLVEENSGRRGPEPPVLMLPILYASGGFLGKDQNRPPGLAHDGAPDSLGLPEPRWLLDMLVAALLKVSTSMTMLAWLGPDKHQTYHENCYPRELSDQGCCMGCDAYTPARNSSRKFREW